MKIGGINQTYQGLILRLQPSVLSKDPDAHAAAHPGVRGPRRHVRRLPGVRRHPAVRAARSSRINGISIADACVMQISDLATGSRCRGAVGGAVLAASRGTLDSFVEIGLGYLSLDRPSAPCPAERRSA